MTERTPWARLLALSLTLGVAPSKFWRLSLKEWRALVSPAHETLTRAAFDALASRFPDNQR
ncbi:MAG TPA: phage tail assembly chaperone [Candidatus Binatia bacterium]|nr:phage tail assembly chaperone [Candidatus Binatia bacterium]